MPLLIPFYEEVLSDEPTVYYQFDEIYSDTTVHDSSGNGLDQTQPDASRPRLGAPSLIPSSGGSSCFFDYTIPNYFSGVNIGVLRSSGDPFALEAVAQFDPTQGSTGGVIASLGNAAWSRGPTLVYDHSTYTLSFYGSNNYPSTLNFTLSTTVDLSTPHHLVALVDAVPGNACIYIDGLLAATTYIDTPGWGTLNTFSISTTYDVFNNTAGYWSGNIDDIAVWANTCPLTPERIFEHYQAYLGVDMDKRPDPPDVELVYADVNSLQLLITAQPESTRIGVVDREISVDGIITHVTTASPAIVVPYHLESNTPYEVSVRDSDFIGPGGWSAPQTFSTQLGAPSVRVVTSGTDLVVSWTEVPYVSGYLVRVDEGVPTDVGNILTYTFSGLDLATPHTFEVAAYAPE